MTYTPVFYYCHNINLHLYYFIATLMIFTIIVLVSQSWPTPVFYYYHNHDLCIPLLYYCNNFDLYCIIATIMTFTFIILLQQYDLLLYFILATITWYLFVLQYCHNHFQIKSWLLVQQSRPTVHYPYDRDFSILLRIGIQCPNHGLGIQCPRNTVPQSWPL